MDSKTQRNMMIGAVIALLILIFIFLGFCNRQSDPPPEVTLEINGCDTPDAVVLNLIAYAPNSRLAIRDRPNGIDLGYELSSNEGLEVVSELTVDDIAWWCVRPSGDSTREGWVVADLLTVGTPTPQPTGTIPVSPTAESTAVIRVTINPDGEYLIARANQDTPIYAAPDLNSPEIGSLEAGDVLSADPNPVTNSDGVSFNSVDMGDGTIGYVLSDNITFLPGLDGDFIPARVERDTPVYSLPDLNSPEIGSFSEGQTVQANPESVDGLGGGGERFYAVDLGDGEFGYVPVDALTFVRDFTPTPTITPPPTATPSPTPTSTPTPTPMPTATRHIPPTFTPVPGPLTFEYDVTWMVDEDDRTHAINLVRLTPRGGLPPYTYYRDDILQSASVFTYRWRVCAPNPVSYRVDSADGQSVRVNLYERPPCP